MDGIYRCSMSTPMGNIQGTITLVTRENDLSGIIETMGMKNEFRGGKIVGNRCMFEGKLKTILGELEYKIVGTVVNENLEIIAQTNKGEFVIRGKKV